MNIQEKIIKMVNEYDYENDVAESVRVYENNHWQEGHTMYLIPNIDSEFDGDEEEIVQKVAQQVITFRIIEKTFLKLMSEGIIHPIEISNGTFNQAVTYNIIGSTPRTIRTTLYFPRSVFTCFMKV